MTLEEQRDIIQAAIDGKHIQYKICGGDWDNGHRVPNPWRDCGYYGFNFDRYEYRIAPVPPEWRPQGGHYVGV